MTPDYPDDACKPERDHALRIWRRGDARWREPDGDQIKPHRPWLVLSDEPNHKFRLFLASLMTHATNRSDRRHLIPNNEGYVEPQQIWTFLFERVKESRESIRVDAGTPANVRRWLARYLTYSHGKRRAGICQGRIVGIRLTPRTVHDPSAKTHLSPQLRRTDLEDMKDAFDRLKVNQPQPTEDFLLPAMVLTADEFLPPRISDYRAAGLFPLVTVVPLVRSPSLMVLKGPKISWPDLPDTTYVPVTQKLLTLDQERIGLNRHSRIVQDYPGLERRCADDGARALVQTDVARFLGLKQRVDA